LVLAGHGVEVTVVEKYLNDWITSFHPPFYESVLETLAEDWPGIDPTPIERVLSRATHEGVPGVRILRCGLEEIDEVAGGSMDITLSNAVFEHLANAKAAIEQLHRVTRPGGIGTHQIDMRWHLDFERPLEYCAMSDVEFANELSRTNCGCGNRHRYDEFSSFFESAGFVIDKLEPNLFADDDYLDDLIPRAQPRFQAMGKEVLRILSAHYLVLKPQE
jgi:SAM-dependent methyltransferase